MTGHDPEDDKPTELTHDDIDKFVEILMNQEISRPICSKCSKKYFHSYGEHINECDECWFSRFPKKDVEEFYRSFFE